MHIHEFLRIRHETDAPGYAIIFLSIMETATAERKRAGVFYARKILKQKMPAKKTLACSLLCVAVFGGNSICSQRFHACGGVRTYTIR